MTQKIEGFAAGPWFKALIVGDLREQWSIQLGRVTGWRDDSYMRMAGICNEATATLIQLAPDLYAENERLHKALWDLGMLCIQSDRYQTDAEFREATDVAVTIAEVHTGADR